QDGETNAIGHGAGFVHVSGDAVGRLPQAEPFDHGREFLTVFGGFNRVDAGADDRRPGVFERAGQVKRRLPAKLHDDAVRLHTVANIEYVLDREGLEEQQVARVVVGADRLGIRVDHDRLDAQLAQRETRMATAVVEFDPLADPVGPAAEDHDTLAARRLLRNFILLFIGGVVVRRVRFEFRRAGIDALVDRANAMLQATLADLHFADAE